MCIRDRVKQRNVLVSRRDALDEEVVEGVIDPETFNRLESKIAQKIGAIDARKSDITAAHDADPLPIELAETTDLAEWREDASVEGKRRLTRLLMDIHIKLGKAGAKKSDPNRVVITWKQ